MLSAFTAGVVKGSGRGKKIGSPTINLSPTALTAIGRDGVYAVWAIFDGDRLPAVMHAGDRPVFNDTPSVEIHLLDTPPRKTPSEMTVEVVEFLRPIENFDSVEELQRQIRNDILLARATLGMNDESAA